MAARCRHENKHSEKDETNKLNQQTQQEANVFVLSGRVNSRESHGACEQDVAFLGACFEGPEPRPVKSPRAFEEAAYRSKIRPSHVKCPQKRQTVKTHWFTRVANQDFEVSTGVKRSMRALYNKLTKAILECERKYKELKAGGN